MSVPTLDSRLGSFAQNFGDRITADPQRFSLAAEDAQRFDDLLVPYLDARQAAASPGTRSRSLVTRRREAKAALLIVARALYARVQASDVVPDADKLLLGVVVRKPRTRIGRPTAAPTLWVRDRYANSVRVRAHEAGGPSTRARPAGTATITLFTFVGPVPPQDVKAWTFDRVTNKTTVDLTFPSHLPAGTPVHVCACWQNRRGESGPLGAVTSTVLAGGGMARAAA